MAHTKTTKNGAQHTETDALDEIHEDATLEACELAAETLTGDIRDFILQRLRHEQDKRPWDKRSEAEQRDTIHAVETSVREHVTRAVEIIAAGGLKTIKATLSQVTIKDGIKGQLEVSKFDEQRHRLTDAVGSTVLIVVADTDQFSGEREPVAVNPDQGDLVKAVAGVVHSDDFADRHSNPLN
jgi:phosphoribosylformylglycinamidine (FGAM) synthase-like enzyme